MAQTKRKRKRKHRGTQGGSLDRRRRRPRTRDEARAQARRRPAADRRDRLPSWQSAFNRALLMGAILFALLAFIAGQEIGPSLFLSVFMVGIYTPAGYYLERFLYNRRRASEQKKRQQAQAQRGR